MSIDIDLNKAKMIAYDKCKADQIAELAFLNVKVFNSAEAKNAELTQQTIRNKYAILQTKINEAQTIKELKTLLL